MPNFRFLLWRVTYIHVVIIINSFCILEVTIEEWIKMMEENKLKEMTPEARVKYEERKKLWLEQRRQKDEERQEMEEEKLRKNREMIEEEYL